MRSFACLFLLALLAVPAQGAAPAGEPLPAQRDAAASSRADVRTATAALLAAGYAAGPVDGDWDAADRAALLAYQADWRLPETGALTPELLLRLVREHAETGPRWAATDTGCRVWNRYPQAQETVRWSGLCVGGASSGEGRLVWRSVHGGAVRVETYTGQRRAGREHGLGLYAGADGSTYRGRWRDGLKHGFGRYVSPEGHVYTGGYRDGLRHGEGSYVRTDGSRYDGAWREGVQHGEGVAIWPDGSRYEGRLADGKPEGAGTLTFADGNVYSGEWRAGCFAEGLRGATAGVTQADCGWR